MVEYDIVFDIFSPMQQCNHNHLRLLMPAINFFNYKKTFPYASKRGIRKVFHPSFCLFASHEAQPLHRVEVLTSADQADLTTSMVGFPWSVHFNTGCSML